MAGWERLEEAAGVGRELVLGNHKVMVVEHQASPGLCYRTSNHMKCSTSTSLGLKVDKLIFEESNI